MRAKPEGLVLGPARLLIPGILACLAGCVLTLFLGASPASAEDTPHTGPRVLEGLTATVSSAEHRATTVTDTITRSGLSDRLGQAGTPLEKLGHATTATTTTLVTAPPVATALQVTAGLNANVAGLLGDLSLSDFFPDWLPASLIPAAGAQVPTTASPATPEPTSAEPTSAAAASSASGAATIAEASAASPPAPSNSDPSAPPGALVGASSSSAGSGGGAAVAAPSDAAWTPALGTGLNATQSDSVPSSSNDGSDPAPD